MTDFVARPDVHARFLLVKARADQRVIDEWAALRDGPKVGGPWNPSNKSPEELKARQKRNSIRRKRPAAKAGFHFGESER